MNKTPFFLTFSQKIYFTSVNHLENSTVPEVFKSFKEVYQYYPHSGFHIATVHADDEFGPLKRLIESLPGIPLENIVVANEHVPDIDRQIRVVKEWCRATRHGLPFQKIIKLLTTHIVPNTVKILNLFPTKGGISDSLIPKTIMSGETLDFQNNIRI